jgi:Rod binding domain-containing protein
MDAAPLASAAPQDAARTRNSSAIEAKAREIAQEFEGFFISTMLETMSSGLEVDPTFGGGHGETVYRSMLNDEYARTFSRAGGIGIADSVYREIMRLQEAQ